MSKDEINRAISELRKKGVIVTAKKRKAGLEVDWTPVLRYLGLEELKLPTISEQNRKKTKQSTGSRLRSAWAAANAPTDWIAMITLTYGDKIPTNSNDVVRFLESVRKKFGKSDYFQMLEFQTSKKPHFHVFFGSGGGVALALTNEPTKTVNRKDKQTGEVKPIEVYCGPVEKFLVETWLRIAWDGSKKMLRFQWGGIFEPMRFPDGAARYVAKEASKRVQKQVPPGFEISNWYSMSRHLYQSDDEFVEVLGVNRDGINKRVWDGSTEFKHHGGKGSSDKMK